MPEQLTADEINTLIEAVEIWKDVTPVEGDQMSSMVNGILSGDRDAIKLAMQAAQEKMRREKTLKRESAILLQAKLLQLRASLEAQEAADFLKRGA